MNEYTSSNQLKTVPFHNGNNKKVGITIMNVQDL